jgi:hypothetical protein
MSSWIGTGRLEGNSMAEREEEVTVEGTMIFGADGAVYFIPSEHLEAYRVPDDQAAEARALEGLTEVQGFSELSGVDSPLALRGPLASRIGGVAPFTMPRGGTYYTFKAPNAP